MFDGELHSHIATAKVSDLTPILNDSYGFAVASERVTLVQGTRTSTELIGCKIFILTHPQSFQCTKKVQEEMANTPG